MTNIAKRITSVLIILTISVQLFACTKQEPVQEQAPQSEVVSSQVGEKNATMFFNFTVNSVQNVNIYDDYVVDDGSYKLVLAEITLENAHSEDAITIKDSEFVLCFSELEEEKIWCYDAFTDKMMPTEVNLAQGESVTYDLLFAAPIDKTDGFISYSEAYLMSGAGAVEGDKYNVHFTI